MSSTIWSDRLKGFAGILASEKTKRESRANMSVRGFCIHGESDCVRCATEDFETQGIQPAQWQELDEVDLRKIVMSLPDKVHEILRRHPGKCVLAGGYIRANIGNEDINDIDLFFNSQAEAKEALNDQNLAWGILDKCLTVDLNGREIQAIFRYPYKNPVDVPDQFDFTVCKAAIWFDEKSEKYTSACHERFYRDIARKELVYLSDRDVEHTAGFLRLLKYTRYGYTIGPESLTEYVAKICLSLDPDKGFDGLLEDMKKSYKTLGSNQKWVDRNKKYVPPRRDYSSGS